jgi:protein-S-isoprenylcysteine O-methyltransferase Ste14
MWLLEDPAARVVVVGSMIAFVAVEAGTSLPGLARRRAGGSAQDRGTRWIIGVATYAGVVGAALVARGVPALRAGANNWGTLGLGVAIVLAGAALRGWAILTLGRHFRRRVTIETDQRLIRSGPYRLLRHPSYTGMLLVFAGFGLALGSWVSAAVALLGALIGLLPRIRVEERALSRAFGAEYERYERETWRLVPYVW